MWAPDPKARLDAARALKDRTARKIVSKVERWPTFSPGSINAWLLFVTTKPPWWKDPFVEWPELPLTVGQPHEGFFYPDPLGFWSEVRRWANELLRATAHDWGPPEVVALTSLVHVGDHPSAFEVARRQCRPGVVVFLDDAAWKASGLTLTPETHRFRTRTGPAWCTKVSGQRPPTARSWASLRNTRRRTSCTEPTT